MHRYFSIQKSNRKIAKVLRKAKSSINLLIFLLLFFVLLLHGICVYHLLMKSLQLYTNCIFLLAWRIISLAVTFVQIKLITFIVFEANCNSLAVAYLFRTWKINNKQRFNWSVIVQLQRFLIILLLLYFVFLHIHFVCV